jgi:ATP/maltotriose-dependent transcriptional regulator MalT
MIAGENRSTAGRHPPSGSPDLATVGEMLKFLRRRARLTQRQLGLAVGYTEGHICRLEQNQRPPDVATVAALFVPALGLDREPELAASLLALAAGPRGRRVRQHVDGLAGASDGQAIPASPPQAVARTRVEDGLRARLADERRVAICGLAGMGKTSVAALLAREAQPDIPVCWITVTQGVTASAEALVRQLAWFLKTHGHAEAGRLLQHRGTDAAVPLDEQLGLLGAALNRQRVLVCLDNVHLLTPDAVAMAVLAHLVATTCTTLLMTAREDVPLAGVGVYRLGGLEDPEARALVAATAPGTPPELATRLITRTGGSPMLLRLALGQLRDGLGDPAFLVERLENVAQVTSYLLETTLSGLSPAAWRVLSLLAVFRRPVDLRDEHLVELSQECDGPYDLSTALDELQRRLLVDHAAAATLHPLVHDHVYTRMVSDLPRRRRLHRVAAMWSDQVRDFLEASYHFAQAGDATRAADLLTAYSGDLVGRGKALEAAELTESLLRARRPVGDDADALLVDLLTVRGDLLANTVRVADAEAAYRQAMELVNGPRRAQIASRLAQLLIQRGDAPEAVRLCRQAAATVGAANHLLLARIAATTSQAQNRLSNYPEATAEADRALELAGRATGGPPQAVAEVQARAHLTLGQATRIHRRLDAAVAHLTRAVDAALRADRPELVSQARHTLAVVYFEQGDMDAAVALFTEVLARFRQIGDGYGAARVLLALTQVFLNQSALHRALESTTEASEIRLRLGDRPGVANANCVRAEVLLAYGDLDQARDLIEEVVATSTEICSTRERGYQLAVLAQAHLVAGNPAAAVAALRTGLVLPDIAGTALQLLLHEYLAMALIIAGDVDQAEQILSRPDGERAIGAEVPPGIRLDAYAVEVARAIARDDRAAAAQWVATMARYAGETGRTRYREVAARLATAVAGTATPAELPRLIWGA